MDNAIQEHRDSPSPHIYHKWTDLISGDEFRKGMDNLIVLMKEHRTGKILSNTTKMGALMEEEQKWSIEDWLPRALEVEYEAIAIVVSEDIFGKMSVEEILNDASEKSPIKIQYFEDEQKAAEWLASL